LAISSDDRRSVAPTDVHIASAALEFAEQQRRSALRLARSVGDGVFDDLDGTTASDHHQAQPQAAAQFAHRLRIRRHASRPRRWPRNRKIDQRAQRQTVDTLEQQRQGETQFQLHDHRLLIAAASDQVAAAHLAANDVTLPLEECLDRQIR
jgi:hypothetical protein